MRPTRPAGIVALPLLVLFGLTACGGEETDSLHPGAALAVSSLPDDGALRVCATGATLEGVDVSHYDGTIDWAQVAASGRKFGLAKATEGITFQDPTFKTNWAEMKQAGLVRGAYHFFRPKDGGAQQADWFLAEVGAFATGDLPPILDWETTDGVASATDVREAQAFVDEIRAVTGLTTIVYSSKRFLATLGSPAQFAGLPLWDVELNVTCPDIPDAWARWTFWQYSFTGTVAGINVGAHVDLDVFNGTLSQLLALTGPGTAGGPDGGVDGGAQDGGSDAGASDAGPGADAGSPDAGLPDAGGHDAGAHDAGPGDAGAADPGADGGPSELTAATSGCSSSGSAPAGALAFALLLFAAPTRRQRH